MPSTWSDLKIELMATGEKNTTWGNITNENLGTAIEEAITGSASVAIAGADVTLTLVNTNSLQTARALRLVLTGAPGAPRNLILGAGCQISKQYIIDNQTDAVVTVKNTTGTGVAVPAGKSTMVFNDGVNVITAFNYVAGSPLSGFTPDFVVKGGPGGGLISSPILFEGPGIVNVLGRMAIQSPVAGDNHITVFNPTDARILLLTSAGNTGYMIANGVTFSLVSGAGGPMELSTGGLTRMTIGADGNTLFTNPVRVDTPTDTTNVYFLGATAGLRMGSMLNAGLIQAVDETGSAAFKPMVMTAVDYNFNKDTGVTYLRLDASGATVNSALFVAGATTINNALAVNGTVTVNSGAAPEIARFGSNDASPFITLYSGGVRKAFIQNTPTALALTSENANITLGVSAAIAFAGSALSWRPAADNVCALGLVGNRWTTVFATTGAINTSDAREKDWRGGLNDAELRAAKGIGKAVGIYRWLDAVEAKGDAARLHAGVTAQTVMAAMEAEGLDPFAYGFVCYDEWEAEEAEEGTPEQPEIVEDGVVTQPHQPAMPGLPGRAAGNRYGVRYEELAMFILAAQEQRLAALEAAAGVA